MLEVGDLEYYFDVSLAIGTAGFHVADIGITVADDGSDLFQQALT